MLFRNSVLPSNQRLEPGRQVRGIAVALAAVHVRAERRQHVRVAFVIPHVCPTDERSAVAALIGHVPCVCSHAVAPSQVAPGQSSEFDLGFSESVRPYPPVLIGILPRNADISLALPAWGQDDMHG